MSFSDYDGDFVRLEVEEVEAETEKAWLVWIDGIKVWLPKSACEYDDDTEMMYLPAWLAKTKGLA